MSSFGGQGGARMNALFLVGSCPHHSNFILGPLPIKFPFDKAMIPLPPQCCRCCWKSWMHCEIPTNFGEFLGQFRCICLPCSEHRFARRKIGNSDANLGKCYPPIARRLSKPGSLTVLDERSGQNKRSDPTAG